MKKYSYYIRFEINDESYVIDGENAIIDLNGDGVNDVEFDLKKVDGYNTLVVTGLPQPTNVVEGKTITETTQLQKEKTRINLTIVYVVMAVIVLGGLIFGGIKIGLALKKKISRSNKKNK